MKILVIGKEGLLQKNTAPSVYAPHRFVYVPNGSDDDTILSAARDAQVIIVDAMGKVSANVISQMPDLKMIHSEGVGYQGVDLEAARERKIYVCNCKGMNAMAVAEQTIFLMLGLLRGGITGDRAVREGRQIEVKERHMLTGDLKELSDCTVGFVGFGDIARAAAKTAAVFGAEIVYYKPSGPLSDTDPDYNKSFQYLPLDDLLKISDIVSLHLPVTSKTANSVNRDFFHKMKDGSYLVNTARGELVDSHALLEALQSGKLAGAGLDCIAGEPVRLDNDIFQAGKETEDKIIFSPHVGGITAASFRRGHAMVWDDIEKLEAGERPDHVVNPWF